MVPPRLSAQSNFLETNRPKLRQMFLLLPEGAVQPVMSPVPGNVPLTVKEQGSLESTETLPLSLLKIVILLPERLSPLNKALKVPFPPTFPPATLSPSLLEKISLQLLRRFKRGKDRAIVLTKRGLRSTETPP